MTSDTGWEPLTHGERLAAARAAVDYLCERTEAEQQQAVPNCPGWTVYNAAAHVGRVSIAWAEMMTSLPDDPESRTRGYARSAEQPPGTSTEQLSAWAHAALDHLVSDLDRRCYFSMTGGEGTVDLWTWHAATELGIHRLDVEHALGHPHNLANRQAADALAYTCRYFLPAMRRVTETDPGAIEFQLQGADGTTGTVVLESDSPSRVTVAGPPTQLLLAVWGRAHSGVEIDGGDSAVWGHWRDLPSQAFQFGTWD